MQPENKEGSRSRRSEALGVACYTTAERGAAPMPHIGRGPCRCSQNTKRGPAQAPRKCWGGMLHYCRERGSPNAPYREGALSKCWGSMPHYCTERGSPHAPYREGALSMQLGLRVNPLHQSDYKEGPALSERGHPRAATRPW